MPNLVVAKDGRSQLGSFDGKADGADGIEASAAEEAQRWPHADSMPYERHREHTEPAEQQVQDAADEIGAASVERESFDEHAGQCARPHDGEQRHAPAGGHGDEEDGC